MVLKFIVIMMQNLFVFSEESGDYQNRKNKSFKNYLSHLFGRKGGGNLRHL